MKTKFVNRNEYIRENIVKFVRDLPFVPLHEVIIREIKSIRTLEQNAKMWAMLTDISEQVEWHGIDLSKEDWKEMITAALKKQKVVPGIDGGFVVIGASTSKMSIKEMIDVIDFAYSFGIEHNVKWTEPTKAMREWEYGIFYLYPPAEKG